MRAFTLSPRLITDSVVVVDTLVIVACSLMAHFLYWVLVLGNPADVLPMIGAGIISAAIFHITQSINNPTRFETLVDLTGQVGRLLIGWMATVLILIAIAFLLKISESFSRGWLISWFALASFLLLVERAVVSRLLKQWAREGWFSRRVAIVGAGILAGRLCNHLISQKTNTGVDIVGVFDDRKSRVESVESDDSEFPILGNVNDLVEYSRLDRIDEVIIALPWSAETRVAKIVQELSSVPADIRLCPDLVGLRYVDRPYSRVGRIALLDVYSHPIRDWAWIAKVTQDYVIAALALMVTAPLMLMIAAAIKLHDGGHVFFIQRRRGFNHNIIPVYKFRTMSVMEDGAVAKQATQNDSRITPVGHFLRKTSLDELPQLINVVRGEMSLVGPRPHPMALDDQFKDSIERYASRHRVKPGITGWAQINGFRGETDTVDKMANRIECDLHYIENWSLWFDFKILLLTPFKGFINENAR